MNRYKTFIDLIGLERIKSACKPTNGLLLPMDGCGRVRGGIKGEEECKKSGR